MMDGRIKKSVVAASFLWSHIHPQLMFFEKHFPFLLSTFFRLSQNPVSSTVA